jgi:hypothetical protein
MGYTTVLQVVLRYHVDKIECGRSLQEQRQEKVVTIGKGNVNEWTRVMLEGVSAGVEVNARKE